MDLPGLPDIRTRSPLLTEEFPEPAGDEALTMLIQDASALVSALTCRFIGEYGEGDCTAAVPTSMEPLVMRAIVLEAEAMFIRTGTSAARRKAIKNGNLQSISAGPWSETYFGPDAAMKAQMLDLDPALHQALWVIATECCQAQWLALWSGEQPGAAGPVSYDWGARPGGYPGSWLDRGW